MNVELRGLVKTWGRTRALDNVSLTLAPGQIVCLLGANGAGKTTLLCTIHGLIAPDAGGVWLDGRPFRRSDLELRRRMFFLADASGLFADQSVLRNLAVILRLYDADRPENEARVLSIMGELDLLPLAREPVGTLSRGQAYKVGLAALLAADPELWLLDEPFAAGLDPAGIDALKRHARAAAARGRTIIYSTQLLEVAERFADRACVLHQGRVHACDTLAVLRERAADQDNPLQEMFRKLRESAG